MADWGLHLEEEVSSRISSPSDGTCFQFHQSLILDLSCRCEILFWVNRAGKAKVLKQYIMRWGDSVIVRALCIERAEKHAGPGVFYFWFLSLTYY